MGRPVVIITEGPGGTGKTFARCAAYLSEEFLPDEVGTHFSNFPIFKPSREDAEKLYADIICEYVCGRWNRDIETLRPRLQLLPPEVEAEWRVDIEEGGSGPWEYFKGKNITGYHIALDEAHTMIGKLHSKAHRTAWMGFLGELRHQGATIELITQNTAKLAKEMATEAALRYSLVDGGRRRDPIFNVICDDWYELRAAFLTGKFVGRVWQHEYRKDNSAWVLEDTKSWPLSPKYFRLYDSYDAPKGGGEAASEPPKREFQRRGKIDLLLWFFVRNSMSLIPRFSAACFFIWLGLLGGAESLVQQFFSTVKARTKMTRERLKGDRDVASDVPPARPSSPVRDVVVREVADVKNDLPPSPVVIDGPVPVGLPVCGLLRNGVLLDGGEVVTCGEEIIQDGPVLYEVNFDRGTLVVDGRLLRLSEVAQQRNSAGAIRGDVQRVGANPGRAAGGAGAGPVARVPGGSDADTGSAHVAGANSLPDDHLGQVPGYRAGDALLSGGAIAGRPAVNRAPLRYGSKPTGKRVVGGDATSGGLRGASQPVSSSAGR